MREVKLPAGWTPYAVAGGPGGEVWTTLLAPAGLGRVADAAFEDIPAGGQPMLLTFDDGGNLWYTRSDDSLGRRDPAGRHEQKPLSADSAPYGLGIAPDGAVWFTAPGVNRIGRLAGDVDYFDLPVPEARAAMLTVAPDGVVWAALNGAGTLARVRDGVVDIVELPSGSAPVGIAASATEIWYADIAGGCVGRVSFAGEVEQIRFADPQCRPHAVAPDPDGGCWATLWGSGQLARVTASGGITLHDLPGEEPHGLWVSETQAWVAMESGSMVVVDRGAGWDHART